MLGWKRSWWTGWADADSQAGVAAVDLVAGPLESDPDDVPLEESAGLAGVVDPLPSELEDVSEVVLGVLADELADVPDDRLSVL